MEVKHILLREFLNNDFAVSTEDGDKLFHEIKGYLDSNQKVSLDFDGIVVVITAFLNASIGSLYNNLYSDQFIDEHLLYENVSDSNRKYINLVIDNAKKYFKNVDGFDKNTDDLLNG